MAFLPPWYLPRQEVWLRSVSGTFKACRAHLFKEAGRLHNNNQMDQNEGVLRHPADCPSLFERDKVTKKKDINACTGE